MEGFSLLNSDMFRHGQPHELYDLLREHSPVYRHPGNGDQPDFWALTRFEDIRAVSLDGENFTSTRGFIIPTEIRSNLDPEIGIALSRFMLAMDNPEHQDFRAVVVSAFMPSALKQVLPRIQASVDALFQSLEELEEADFVNTIAATVPIKTICAIMGIPAADEARVFEFTNTVFGIDDPELAASADATNEGYRALFEYGWDLLEARRRDPRDDLLTRIAHGTVGGRPLTPTEQKGFFSNLIAAGNETTRSTLAGSIYGLAKHPDQRQALIADPALLSTAINELIRWFSPVYHFSRVARRDVVVGGQAIGEGERVAMLYGAGNHDPAMFVDPHQLDIHRNNAKANLAFGYGIHNCLGSRLALMQLDLILSRFLLNFPEYEILSEPTFIRSNLVQAMKTLPVRLRN